MEVDEENVPKEKARDARRKNIKFQKRMKRFDIFAYI